MLSGSNKYPVHQCEQRLDFVISARIRFRLTLLRLSRRNKAIIMIKMIKTTPLPLIGLTLILNLDGQLRNVTKSKGDCYAKSRTGANKILNAAAVSG